MLRALKSAAMAPLDVRPASMQRSMYGRTATECRSVVRAIDQDAMNAAVTRTTEAYLVGRSGITT
jgi:hypothetical protein